MKLKEYEQVRETLNDKDFTEILQSKEYIDGEKFFRGLYNWKKTLDDGTYIHIHTLRNNGEYKLHIKVQYVRKRSDGYNNVCVLEKVASEASTMFLFIEDAVNIVKQAKLGVI